MKWFKHMSASWEDEKLSRIVDEAGLEGYGFWWRMVEIVASKVDENNITLVTFSLKKWCSLFVVRPQKLRRLLTLCEDCGMFKSVSDGDMITVDIPNILKYRDEWTKKKASKKPKTPESLPSKEEDTDTEEDTENIYTPKLPSSSPAKIPRKTSTSVEGRTQSEQEFYLTKRKRKLTGKRLEAFNRFWEAFGHKLGKSEAADAFLDIPEITNSLMEQILTAARREAVERPHILASGRTPIYPQGWLSARRWEDEPSPDALHTQPQSLEEMFRQRGVTQ